MPEVVTTRSSVKRASQQALSGWLSRREKPEPAEAETMAGVEWVVALKSRSLAATAWGVVPELAWVPEPCWWATCSTALVVARPLYSWMAMLMLPAFWRVTVTVRLPPVTLGAYQMLRGSVAPLAGEGSSIAFV